MCWVLTRSSRDNRLHRFLGLDGPNGVAKLGDAEPIFQMNTYNELTFQNKWSLRFLLHWKNGGQNVNLTALQNDFGQTSADFDKIVINPQTQQPMPLGVYRISQVGYSAQQFVENSGYLKLREIGLYYSFNTFGKQSDQGPSARRVHDEFLCMDRLFFIRSGGFQFRNRIQHQYRCGSVSGNQAGRFSFAVTF